MGNSLTKPQVSFVVPLYNEELGLSTLVERLDAIIEKADFSIEVVFVNDGSKDKTAELMQALAYSNEHYHCVFLSRNFGHQLAVTAGMTVAKATEAVLVIDGDLQDPPELVFDFYDKVKNENFDVVYGVRTMRDDEGLFKKKSSAYFYNFLQKMADIEIPVNSGDFCMMSRKVVDVMNKMPEDGRFLRGMRAWVGFKQTEFHYDRQERVAGETKYTLKKMVSLAMNAIFGFSDIPIKLMTRAGVLTILFAFLYLVWSVIKKYVFHFDVENGFSGLLFAMILLSGVQLFSLGIIGEYVVRTFFQVKNRPLFLISNRIEHKKEV